MTRLVALPRLYAHKHQTCARMAGWGIIARHVETIATFAPVTMAIFRALSTAVVYGFTASTARAA